MSSATGSQQWMYNSDDAIYNGVVSTSARFDDDGGANHLYKTYYGYLDKQFSKYERDFNRAVLSGKKQYTQLKKSKKWKKTEAFPFRNVA